MLGIPEDNAAERAVLGAVMLNNSLFSEVALLTPRHFVSPKHRQIFTAMAGLYEADQPIDPVTLLGAMSGQELDVAGSELTDLVNGIPVCDNLTHYVESIITKATMRDALRVVSSAINALSDPEAKLDDVQAVVKRLTDITDASISFAGAISLEEYGPIWAQELEEKRNGANVVKIPLGFTKLDRALGGGGTRGKLITVGGRTGMGKSALMTTIGADMARRGYKVLIQEMEMSRDELLDRIVAAETRIDSRKLAGGLLTDEETVRAYNAAMTIASWPLTINDGPKRTPEHLFAEIRQLHRAKGLDCVIVDYVLLPRYRTRDLRIEVGIFLKELRILAKELDILIVAGAQLNRGADDLKEAKRPKLSDFKETGSIEEDSDVCLFPYRPSYFPGAKQQVVETDAEVIIAKQRQGPTGTIYMEFHPAYTLYRERYND